MDYKAFVSSTFIDLQGHRKAVIDALRDGGFFVDPMENWTSSADEPKDFSARRLYGCHLCVLLVARRRGHLPEGSLSSITQIEYLEAKKRRIDILPFLLDDGEPAWPTEWDELAADAELRRWRADISEHYGAVRFGREPASLKIAPALTRWVQEMGPKVALRLYLENVKREHGAIRFVSMTRLEDVADARIDRLYVEPALAPRWVSPDAAESSWPPTTGLLDALTPETGLSADAAPRARPMVLLGDPGSGKSTLVSWVAWQLAQQHDTAGSWTERLGRRIPLPIVLRELRIGPEISWDSLLAMFVQTPTGRLLTLANLQRLLEDGRAMLMLDGLDEISSPLIRRALRDAIHAGIERYPDCRWLLTSRVVGYDDVPFDRDPSIPAAMPAARDEPRVHLRYVAPFDEKRIERFAHQWFVLRESVETRAPQQAEDFLAALRSDEATGSLARVPNLLTMMALIFRVRARLPHGRALLYTEIAQAYLETIDYYRRIATRAEPLRDKKRWLSRVAFEMQHQRAGRSATAGAAGSEIYASGEATRGWVEAAMRETAAPGSRPDAQAFVDYLGRRTGLLLPRGEDRFAFMHLSFQEYFAADYLREQIVSPGWEQGAAGVIDPRAAREALKAYARSPVWRETLVFLIELFAAEQARWLDTVQDSLFGPAFGDLDPDRMMGWRGRFEAFVAPVLRRGEALAARRKAAQQQASLVARLMTNPHAGLDPAKAKLLSRHCSFWAAVAESERASWEEGRGPLLDAVLGTAGTDFVELFDHFCGYARDVGLARLDLSGLKPLCDPSPLARIDGLRKLRLDSTGTDSLSSLAGLRGLNELSLKDTGIADLAPLSGLHALTRLDLRRTRIDGMAAIAGLVGLQEINVGFNRLTDLEAVRQLRCLVRLDIDGTDVTDLEPVADLARLKEFWLMFTKVSDVRPLAQLTMLENLQLYRTGVADLTPLAGLGRLRTLGLENTPVTDLSPLGALPALSWLMLDGTQVTTLAPIGNLPALRRLDAARTKVSDLMPLLGCADSLETVNLRGSPVGEANIAAFRTAWSLKTSRELKIIV